MKHIQTGKHTFHPLAPDYRRGEGHWECETADRYGRIYIIRFNADTLHYEILHEGEQLRTSTTMREACGWVAEQVKRTR